MNAQSSRSHTIFKIVIESRERLTSSSGSDRRLSGEDDDGVDRSVRVASLNLVDLAGSENAKQTGAEGELLLFKFLEAIPWLPSYSVATNELLFFYCCF